MSNWLDESILPSINARWLQRENGVLGHEGKRSKALASVYKKAKEVLDTLPGLTIFSPSVDHAGQVMRNPRSGTIFVYLSPTLEFNSQRDVNHVVAHELAHIVLGHHIATDKQTKECESRYEERPTEIAANTLAAEWGFPKRKRGKPKFVKVADSLSRRLSAKAA